MPDSADRDSLLTAVGWVRAWSDAGHETWLSLICKVDTCEKSDEALASVAQLAHRLAGRVGLHEGRTADQVLQDAARTLVADEGLRPPGHADDGSTP